MEFLTKTLAVAIGGALGAVLRFFLNLAFVNFLSSFPFATFFINLTGSFLIGLILTLSIGKLNFSETFKLFLSVGFLGAYTTFSTFEFETYLLLQQKRLWTAFFYVSLSFSLGLIGVLFGVWCGKEAEKFFS